MALNKVKIGSFVEKHSEKCGLSNLTVNDVSGINRDKEFFEPSNRLVLIRVTIRLFHLTTLLVT